MQGRAVAGHNRLIAAELAEQVTVEWVTETHALRSVGENVKNAKF